MADNVAVTTLEIRGTEKVATTMKELKEQIKSYRDELVVLGQVEDKDEQQKAEQVAVIERLQKATKLLSEVTNAHKQSMEGEARQVDIMNDSYNALQAEMSRLKKAYKEMSAAERESDLGSETLGNIQQLDIKLKELDAGMGQYQRNVGNYGQTFEESMGQARQNCGFLEQGMGTLMAVMGLAGTENKALITTVAGLQLALQAFNNEGVQKVIISIREWIAAKIAARAASKAQQAEAKATAAAMTAEAVATQGATAATNTFKKALIATGIGAIVVLIGTLVANLDILTSAFGKAAKNQKALNKAMAEGAGNAAEEVVQLKILEAVATDVARSEEERTRAATLLLDKLGETINATNIAAVRNGEYAGSIELVTKALVQQARAQAAIDLIREKQAELLKKQTKVNQFAGKDPTLWDNIVAGASQGTATAADVHAARAENKQAQVQALQKEFDKWLESLMKNFELTDFDFGGKVSTPKATTSAKVTSTASSKSSTTPELDAQAQEIADKLLHEANSEVIAQMLLEFGESVDEINEALAEEEAELNAVADAEVAAISEVVDAKKAALEEEKALLDEKTKAEAKAVEEMMEGKKKEVEAEEAAAKARKDIAVKLSSDYASATASMFDAIANAIEATAEEDEETAKKTKGLRIAGATMTMLQGIVSAVATAMQLGPIAGPILGSINAATVLATGAANIAKIKATDPTTGSSPGGADVPSASVQVPTINRSLPATQILTSASDEARLDKMASDQRVKLVYSDLEVASTDQRVKVEESSF